MVNWGKDDDAFPDDRCCATRTVYVEARVPERASYAAAPRFCAKHNVNGTCLTCQIEHDAVMAETRARVGTCAHGSMAGTFCVHCNRSVPRVGEVTESDRAKAAELAGLPRHAQEHAIAQALADARVDLRVKQS